jgi:exosortase
VLLRGAEPACSEIMSQIDLTLSALDSTRPLGTAPTSHGNKWKFADLGIVAFAVAIGVFLTLDAWRDIFRIAMKDEESSHIFLVPVVMLWLLWENRAKLKGCRRIGTWIGPVVVTVGAGLYLYGTLGWARTVTSVGAVVVLAGCILSVAGTDVLRRFSSVFLALAFLIPVPGLVRMEVAIPLGTATARLAEHILLLFDVPVERAGTLLSINQVDVTIAEACNGLRMVLSLFFVSYLVAFGASLRWNMRAAVLIAAPVLAIICNVIRLIPTLYLYGYASHEWAERFHDAAGWAMLAVAYFSLMGLIRLMRWVGGTSGSPETSAAK